MLYILSFIYQCFPKLNATSTTESIPTSPSVEIIRFLVNLFRWNCETHICRCILETSLNRKLLRGVQRPMKSWPLWPTHFPRWMDDAN